MALAIVQHSNGIHGFSTPAGVTLGAAPTAGNLLIALIGTNFGVPTIDSHWIMFEAVRNAAGTGTFMLGLYRYVQPGDTAALPDFVSSGNTYWTHQIWEISGVSGNWDADLAFSLPLNNARSNQALPPIPILGDQLLLSGTASYNGNTNPSISGSWTLDDAANNNSNYGSAAGAHRAVTSGDTIDGQWTQGTSAPFSGIMLSLAAARPLAGFLPRHLYTGVGASLTSAIAVPWTPKEGCLQLGFIAYGQGPASPTLNTTDWTQFIALQNVIGVYRYVPHADASPIPRLATAASDFYLITILEVDGVAGSFADDFVDAIAGAQASGATITTTADASTFADQIALLYFANYDGNAQSSFTGFDGNLHNTIDFGDYGTHFLGFKWCAAPGTAVQSTITPADTGHRQGYIQAIFLNAAGAPASSGGSSGSGSESSTPGLVTQLVRLTVGETEPSARATQLARLVIGQKEPPARTTQMVRLTVAEGVRSGRTTQLVRMVVAAGVPCGTQWCQCWRITRQDGLVLRFTSLDEDFEWGGHVFTACASLNPSASESATALGSVGNIELTGIIANDAISAGDLYGGLFDDAFVEVWLVPYVDGTGEVPKRIAAGWTGSLSQEAEGSFKMEVVGPGARLGQQALTQAVAPRCRWVFGDARCGIDREARALPGCTVQFAVNRGNFTADIDPGTLSSGALISGALSSGADENASQWVNGLVRFESGKNAGQECEAKSVDFQTGQIVLWALPAYLPEAGDEFTLLPGCGQAPDDCKFYANFINFGGFDDVPGDDSIAQVPDAKL